MCTLACPFHSQSAAFFPFFFLCQSGRDAPQRSWTWISFGLTQWKGQMRAPWNGSEAFTSPSQGPESLHHPEMAQAEPGRVSRATVTSSGPPCGSSVPSTTCRGNSTTEGGIEIIICVELFFFNSIVEGINQLDFLWEQILFKMQYILRVFQKLYSRGQKI